MEILDFTPMSNAEAEAWSSLALRVSAAVLVPRAVEGRIDPNGGSGVLVRLGGRDSVFTAGHVVHDDERQARRYERAPSFLSISAWAALRAAHGSLVPAGYK
jgi:hypothetical protein